MVKNSSEGYPSRRVEARDRRQAALHEAGHFVIARHHGVWAVPSIERVDTPRPDEKSWVGTTQMFPYLSRCGLPRRRVIQPTLATRRKIAVAGMIAEAAWRGDLEYVGDLFLAPEEISPTDFEALEISTDDNGWPIIDRGIIRAGEAVARLLGRGAPLWGELLAAARLLIMEGRIYLGLPPPPVETLPWVRVIRGGKRQAPLVL